jgi:GNAT superfamily N-acetyltransferase
MTVTKSRFEVRPYERRDESKILELLSASLGEGPAGRRAPEFFRWKHEENPFGPSTMLVAHADGRIVGLRAFMRWEFRSGMRSVRAVRAVDTATHPDYQRLGIFSALTREALGSLDDVDFVFNTPNEKSLPGYLKLGWTVVGRIPVSLRVRRPIRFLRRVRGSRTSVEGPQVGLGPPVSAEMAATFRLDDAAELLDEAVPDDERLSTVRGLDYLRWRYASAPFLDYRVVRQERGGNLAGLAIFRVRSRGRLWESTIAEVIVDSGDVSAARGVIRKVVRATAVDHVTCSFPKGSTAARAALQCGFLPTPGGMTFVVRPLQSEHMKPDPTATRSWALTLGDVEVF